MEKLSQLPLPLKKSPHVDVRDTEVDMTSAHGSRSVSESSRGRANSSSRSSSSSCNSALQSFVNGCRSPRKTGCSSAGRLHPDDYVIAASIGNRRSSTVSTICDSPSPVDHLGGRIVGTSSCGDCTPEVSRRVVEETGNRKNKFGLRDRKPETSTAGFNSQTAENEGPSVVSRLTNRHPTKTKNSTLCPADLQANFQLNGGTNCYKASNFDPRPRTISPRARSSATRPYLEPTFGDPRRNFDDIVTYQKMAAMTSIHVEQCTDDYGPLRGDSPSTPSDVGDELLKQRCETNTGNGSNGGGSPIYHELDPPGGSSTGDGVYKFPQSSSSVQHTYQSIAEISEELNTLRSKSVEQVTRLNNIKRAENIDKRAKNLSIDDQLLIGSCSIKNASSSLKKKQQLQQLTRGPLSPGPMSSGATRVMRDEMVSLTRAKSVQDLGQRGATAGISATQAAVAAAAASSTSSGPKKQSTPKLSIFSRIRFTKKSPSKGSSNHAAATTVNSATTLAGSSIENFNSVPRSGHGSVNGSATASASLDNSRNEPSFSTFTGGTSTHRGVTAAADRLERDSTAPPDEPYSVVYAPRRAVVPPPRNSSLSPASDGRRARLSRDVARTAARDVPSPAGVALSVSPSPTGASVTTGNELPAEPLYKQKFLKIASSSATLHCANSLTVQQSAVRIHNSNSLGNLPLVATSSDLHSSRSPAAGPLTGGSIFPLRAVSGSSMTPEMATVCRLAALTPSGSDYSMSSSYVTSCSAFSYDIYGSGGRNTGVDDYFRGDATPPRSRKIVGGVQRAAGLSPSRVGSFARPSCGVRMAEMRVVARRLTAVGESSGTCSSEYTTCPSPRWMTSNHVPTPIPSPGLAGNRRIPVFQFHFPADSCSSGCSSPTQSVREYRDQSSQTQINVDPISEVRSSDVLTSKSDGLMLSAVGSGPLSRRQMQTIEEEENIDSPEISNVDKSETVDGDSTTRNTAVESVESSEPTPEVKETSRTSQDSASVADVSTACAGISIMPVSCTSSSVTEAAHVPADCEISSIKSSTKLKLPSSSSSVSSGSPQRASRRPLAERTTGSSTAASDAPSAETVRLSQSNRTAASPSSSTTTTPTSRRRGDVTNVCGGGGDQTPTRRRTISTGNSRISRSPAAASSRSETVTDGLSAVSTRARAGSIGSAVSSGHFVPPSTVSCVRGHAPVGDRRRQANDDVTTSSQHGGGRQRNDVASSPGVGRPSMSDATTVMAEPIESVVSVRSRVAAWSKPTTVGCSSVSSSSDGSLASAGADSESDGMPGLTSDPPDQTTHGDHLSKVTLGGRKLLTDKSDQSHKENRLANALMRVEQGTLSEKTRMLLAKISVARSAANDIDRKSGTHIMNQ